MQLTFIDSVSALTEQQWHHITGRDYPFLRHEFLLALESSGATSVDSGWQPSHLVAYHNQQPVALLPLFIKDHSYGEYVFDWAWADAYHRSGLAYYPKLLSAVPFTPATGPRLCWAADLEPQQQRQLAPLMVTALQQRAQQIGASSWHCLFPNKALSQQLTELDCHPRQGCQFHWFNRDFTDFDHFLSTFNSRKRKSLRRERDKVARQGIVLSRLEGSQLSRDDWHRFYHFYRATYLKLSGHGGYLAEDFFTAIGDHLADSVMMVQAHRQGQLVAAALFFKSRSHLYGRYWGCAEDIDGLHFEACYYQGIEYAIERGLNCFDPGAQGEHKIQRGFEPITTHSNHWLVNQRFHSAVADFTRRETPTIDQYRRDAATLLPFKKDP